MIESEDGTVTGSIDVSKLDSIEPKTDEARAQLDALKAEAQAGQEQAQADADKLAEQEKAQSAAGQQEAQQETTAEAQPVGDTGTSDDQSDESDDREQLRAEADALGVEYDKRWGAARLRQEIDAAKQG
jgi:hypothetical protein